MAGIDLQQSRLDALANLYPQVKAIQGDASSLPFADESFDLVYESTLFATLPDAKVRNGVASEMMRVCKADGYLLLIDWRTDKFWSSHYKALTRNELKRLFGAGTVSRLLSVSRGALLPPLGRLLSAYVWPLYFPIAWLCPVLVGQVAYLLQKQSNTAVKAPEADGESI